MAASASWKAVAERWAELVLSGADTPYAWNSAAFLELLPAPGRLTLDVGCGEGRFTRELAARGHRLVAVDVSPTLVRLAREADPLGDYREADAASLPLADSACDLVVGFMSLQDIDDLERAVAEAARVLGSRGRFCFAIVHPVASAGRFEGDDVDAGFAIPGSYLDSFAQEFPLLDATVTSIHRPLEAYSLALENAGFVIEALRELPTRRRAPGRIPTFLHVKAAKP